MTTQEKIKAAQKRIKELAILIALWKQEDKIKKGANESKARP